MIDRKGTNPRRLDFRCVLADAEDDEFGRLHWRDAYIDDQLAQVASVLGIVFVVALHEERLFWSIPEERSLTPKVAEERVDVPAHLPPEQHVVRLEHGPLGSAFDRLLHHVEEAADVEVAPGSVARKRARTPDADAAAGEDAQAVDAVGVQNAL